jgi:uncharacterized protein with NAD-binding domain and iron-sulfur cluster
VDSPDTSPSSSAADTAGPIRVAVVGGGCSALTAAFELTRPELAGRFEVTVYQMGWRLGGKGASGRGVADRIEEHGLHLWMGFYENAFRIMRDCYDELRAACPNRRFAHWQDAFKPAPDIGIVDQTAGGDWEFWLAHFPPGRGLPGDPITDASPFTVRGYLRQSAILIAELLRSAAAAEQHREPRKRKGGDAPGQPHSPSSDANLAATADRLLRLGKLATIAAVFEAADVMRQSIDTGFPRMLAGDANPMLRLIDAIAGAARRRLDDTVRDDGELRRIWQVIDLILAAMRGSTMHALALDSRGFDAINDHDWRDWLRANGASEQSLDSGFMRGIYDLAFAFENGDVARPRLAAGVALRGAMRMFFTYRGSLFWRMSAGMGDVVFAPLYEVLKRRGVKFEFFHRVRKLALSPARDGDRPYVAALEVDVQARVKGGAEYRPLIDVQGLPSWPARPDFAQLEDGAALEAEGRAFEGHWEERCAERTTLRVSDDFDFVILGVGGGAVEHLTRELSQRQPRWRDMVANINSVPTQALQLWLRGPMGEIGWPHAPSNISGFVEPFDTWADMSHLLPEEAWKTPVGAVAYFCSVLPDTTPADGVSAAYHAAQRALVRGNAVRFLDRDVKNLWPGAVTKRGGFKWSLLASAEAKGGRGAARLDTQFFTANVNPSDRYVLSLPGTLQYRLSPLDLICDNLTIAGDWTATGLDTGCIESAVMSGRLAAHALSKHPPLAEIIGYDHP